MSDLISRQDAIDAIESRQTEQWIDSDVDYNNGLESALCEIKALPSADRPTGEVNAVEIYEQAVSELDHNKITLGEYEKKIEPLKHMYYDRPTGEWDSNQSCSICGCKPWYEHDIHTLHYCPNCGARMGGDTE